MTDNYLIMKNSRYWARHKIEQEVVASIVKPTPTPGGTDTAELAQLKQKIADSKELLQRIIKITNVTEKKNGLKTTYRRDIKEAYTKIKAKMGWDDLDSDSEYED